MKPFNILIKNEEHSEAVQKRLFELGCFWGVYGKTPMYREAPRIIVTDGRKLYYSNTKQPLPNWESYNYPFKTLDDLYEEEKEIKIELNDEYRAIVTKDGVKVGCQNFTFEKIKELAHAVEEIEKD